MRLVKANVEFTVGNKKVRADVYEDDLRQGSKSPRAIYLKYKDRWISSYEMKIRHWSGIDLNTLFAVVYGTQVKKLIRDFSSFFSLIPDSKYEGNLYYQPVLLDIGAKFK